VQDLGLYIVTVLAGLFIHTLIVLPLIHLVFTCRNPFALDGGISQALLTAFGTSSRLDRCYKVYAKVYLITDEFVNAMTMTAMKGKHVYIVIM